MLAAERRNSQVVGSKLPRIGPPVPARSSVKEYEAIAKEIGLKPMPWQQYLARFAYATNGKAWNWPEIAAVVARQNGKTTFLLPHIVHRLRQGRTILHVAHKRELPRHFLLRELTPALHRVEPKAKVRLASGQETVELPNGGLYMIAAATSGGPRGLSVDDVIVDELREVEDDFIQAVIPTTIARPNRQIIYLSNAGTDETVALNALRRRASEDPSLAYLEWSADEGRAADDVEGWAEANPALGHSLTFEAIEQSYRAAKLAGTLSHFETENLCRWVSTMRDSLVDEYSWNLCRGETGVPQRPVLAFAMDPKGARASAVLAWQEGENIAIKLLFNVSPVDAPALGLEVKRLVQEHGARAVGFDPLTDKELAKYVKSPTPISGQTCANASARFTAIVNAARLRWDDADAVTDDLTWTASKPNGEGSYHAVRASDDRPITASLAAIRAVWLASGPPAPVARVWT